MQMSPVMTEKDELAVQNVTQLIKFLTGGTGTMSLGSMTPSLAREVTLPSFSLPLLTHSCQGQHGPTVAYKAVQTRLSVAGKRSLSEIVLTSDAFQLGSA